MHAMLKLTFTKFHWANKREMKYLLYLSALLAAAHCTSMAAGSAVNTTAGEDKNVKMIWFGASW